MTDGSVLRTPTASIEKYRSQFMGKPKVRNQPNIRHATVKQVLDAFSSKKQEGRFVLTNSLIFTVKLCGRMISIEQNEAYTDYIIDDGTGCLQGRIWGTSRKGHTDLSGGTKDAYYLVVTHVVTHDNGLLLQTLKASKVEDHNIITMHFLTAIHEDCDLGILSKAHCFDWEKAKRDAENVTTNEFSTTLDKEAIVGLLSETIIRDSNAGATTDYILRHMHLDPLVCRKTLQQMVDEGSIYNTIDYDHYKLADDN